MEIKALLVKPNQLPRVIEIENDLSAFKNIVDGWIESVTLANNVVALVNEEGVLLGMTPNFSIGYTTIVGPAIIVGCKDDEFVSLNEYQIDEAKQIVMEGRY